MRVCNSVFLISTFLVSILISDEIFAIPINSNGTCHPVVHKTCGTWCENNCEQLDAESLPCNWNSCRSGYYCKPGYVKEFKYGYGRCILSSECPVKEDTTIFPVTESNKDAKMSPVNESNEDTKIFPVTESNKDTKRSPVTEHNKKTRVSAVNKDNANTTVSPLTSNCLVSQ